MKQKTVKISFIEAIKKQLNGFRFGTLWRLNDNVLGGVVPILRDDAKFNRGYKLIEEVKEKQVYKVTDTGDISKIKIKMMGNEPIFIRTGTAFGGQGTQSRASEISVILMPERKETEIPARCIHASHHISGGSSFKRYGYVPREVEESLVAREGQGATWSSVGRGSARLYSLAASSGRDISCIAPPELMRDHLIENLEQIKKGKSKIKDIIKKVPCFESQVGVVIFDEKGVHSIEIFNHPDSWKAFHESVIEKYEDILSQESTENIFELKAEVIPKKINQFLDSLLDCEEEQVFNQGTGKTHTLYGNNCIGEYSMIDGSVIHLLGLRKSKEQPKPKRAIIESLEPRPRPYMIRGNSYISQTPTARV